MNISKDALRKDTLAHIRSLDEQLAILEQDRNLNVAQFLMTRATLTAAKVTAYHSLILLQTQK